MISSGLNSLLVHLTIFCIITQRRADTISHIAFNASVNIGTSYWTETLSPHSINALISNNTDTVKFG